VHCPDDQLNQEPIMNELIDGYRVLAQDQGIFVATEKPLMGKRTNTIETVGLPIEVAQSDPIYREVSLRRARMVARWW
jgi:hypothetical protein